MIGITSADRCTGLYSAMLFFNIITVHAGPGPGDKDQLVGASNGHTVQAGQAVEEGPEVRRLAQDLGQAFFALRGGAHHLVDLQSVVKILAGAPTPTSLWASTFIGSSAVRTSR